MGRLHARAGAGEYLDAVCGGELGDEGRIRRDGLGQPQRGSRLARGGDELVESAWRHDHDDPARAGVGDGEAVRDRSRQEHQRARSGLPLDSPDPPGVSDQVISAGLSGAEPDRQTSVPSYYLGEPRRDIYYTMTWLTWA